ncbi:YajA protein (plasmid) [Salmonella enterica subsp. enterica serovar Weltevreden]|nr:YajA protein [Salmonella enterica subsp. enterica serovar Weltevreden]
MKNKPTPEQVKVARIAAGLTLKEAADTFGYQLNSWQMKESAGKASRSLSVENTNYFYFWQTYILIIR